MRAKELAVADENSGEGHDTWTSADVVRPHAMCPQDHTTPKWHNAVATQIDDTMLDPRRARSQVESAIQRLTLGKAHRCPPTLGSLHQHPLTSSKKHPSHERPWLSPSLSKIEGIKQEHHYTIEGKIWKNRKTLNLHTEDVKTQNSRLFWALSIFNADLAPKNLKLCC